MRSFYLDNLNSGSYTLWFNTTHGIQRKNLMIKAKALKKTLRDFQLY